MSTQEQRQAKRMEVLDKMFDPDTKIIGTPHPHFIVGMSGLALYLDKVDGILRTGYEQVKRNVLFLQNGMATPNDHFENALDAFNKNAKKLKICHEPDVNPLLSLVGKELPLPPGGRNARSWSGRADNVTAEMAPRKGDMIMIGNRLCVIKKVKN